ncbi:cyclase family protein [Corallococcus llansteffanensis]|uniref:Kynurenine formamidase n=1 Tax=Corallococcus llansteffanensis TaxID=2316731 RepID=A0A3A8QIY8_9BACT|nr:cyclase family protein [Corallococcus llansteffanensis]RKH68537.1 cyclase family protein [Corallococcus llansteffanensis]
MPPHSTLEVARGGAPWVDVTVPVRDGMVHWPDNPPIQVRHHLSLLKGDAANVSHLSLGVHSGTHVDAPVHFLPGGVGVDALPLDRLMGDVRVLSLPRGPAITADALREHLPARGERLLFKTANSSRRWDTSHFRPDFTYLSTGGARFLVEARVRTVGIDYLSIAGLEEGEATHRVLLEAGVCIIEGLDLGQVEPGRYEMVCLPLRLAHGDGAPARVLLRSRMTPTG